MVWEPLGREPALDSFRGAAGITFLGWEEVPAAASLLGCDKTDTVWRWVEEATLAFPGDGHPTGKANELVASALTGRIAASLPKEVDGGAAIQPCFSGLGGYEVPG